MIGKSIAIIVANGSEDIETIVPADIWRRAGIKVSIISIEDSINIELSSKTKIIADELLNISKLSDYTGLYFPGGKGFKNYFKFDKESEFIKKINDEFINNEKKYLLAMCAAPSYLISVGLINNRNYTCYPGYETEMKQTYKDESVVYHENLITANGPGSVFEFAYKVVDEIVGSSEELSKEMMWKK